MEKKETYHLILAGIILAIIIAFQDIINLDFSTILTSIIFAALIIALSVSSKKIAARALDSNVTHEIWQWSRYGIKPHQKINKSIPAGIILPLIISAFSLGQIKFMAFLTYETTALKRRAAKRHGYYSFTEMTDWHNALIGASGIIAILLLSFIAYWIPSLESLSRVSAFYAFFNMLPFSKLDGAQIFFGSRPLWYALGIITLIFATYALILV